MGLPDADRDRAGYSRRPPRTTGASGLTLLKRLLAPFGADSAEVAGRLLSRFGTLGGVLAACSDRKKRDVGESDAMLSHLAAVRAAMQHTLRIQALDGAILSTTSDLAAYLRLDMAFAPHEHVRVLFLAISNRLIADEILFTGTVNSSPLHPRPIVHRALDLGAAAIILVHNHPSGNPEPSSQDVASTHELRRTLESVDVLLHDHLIVARQGWVSLRGRGLL